MRFQIPQAPTPLIYPCFRKCQKSSTIVTAKGQQLRETIFRGNAPPPPPPPLLPFSGWLLNFANFLTGKSLSEAAKKINSKITILKGFRKKVSFLWLWCTCSAKMYLLLLISFVYSKTSGFASDFFYMCLSVPWWITTFGGFRLF